MAHRRAAVGIALVLVAAVVTVLTAVSVAHDRGTVSRQAPPGPPVTTADYLPGLAADVVLPPRATRPPVVVLVPGGGWHTADRSGLLPLARALADGGVVAVAVTYTASDDGGRLPGTVAELGCAAGFAVARARAAGLTPGPVVLLGHSAGAHLAALAALAPSTFRRTCPDPPARIDGLVGLAGAYEPASLGDVAVPFFGGPPEAVPAQWRAGDPLTRAARADRRLRVLLLHGDADDTVPPAMTSRFALALRAGGHDVIVQTLAGADHAGAYAAGPVAPRVLAWLRAWGGSASGNG